MAKKSYLYEVLVRGTPDGKLAGAHQIISDVYTDDDTGEIVGERPGMASPLALSDVGGLIGESFTGLANQIADLQAELESAKSQLLITKETSSRIISELTRELNAKAAEG